MTAPVIAAKAESGVPAALGGILCAGDAAWVGWPDFTTPVFDGRAILLIVPAVILVLIAENAGHVKAVAVMTEEDLDPLIGRTLMADGAATTLAGAFGGSGTTTYAENIGVMGLTRIHSTLGYLIAGVLAIALGLLPKFGAIVAAIPIGVLGGAVTVLFGMIAVLGARIWIDARVTLGTVAAIGIYQVLRAVRHRERVASA